MGNYSLFPISGHAQFTEGSPSTLGMWGLNQVLAEEQQIRPCPAALGHDFSSGPALARLPHPSQHFPASLGCPSQNTDPPVPLRASPVTSSAASQNKPRGETPASLPGRNGEAAPDPGRRFPLPSQNIRPPCQHQLGERGHRRHRGVTAPRHSPGGAEPRAPRGAHACQKYRVMG